MLPVANKAGDGSQYALRVVAYRPGLQFVRWLLLAVVFLVTVTGAYMIGYRTGAAGDAAPAWFPFPLGQAGQQLKTLEQSNAELRQANEVMQRQLADAALRADMAPHADDAVREEIVVLKEQIRQLEESNRLYREAVQSGSKSGR